MCPDEAEEELLTYDDLISSLFSLLSYFSMLLINRAFLSCVIINPLLFNRYEEFHPFLFCQHEKSRSVEFESFNKVCVAPVLMDPNQNRQEVSHFKKLNKRDHKQCIWFVSAGLKKFISRLN